MAKAAMRCFLCAEKTAIADRGVCYVAISGGRTPVVFYERFAEKSVCSQLNWDKIHLFWVDERCVPPDDEASNYGVAARTFLSAIPIPSENIHRIRGENKDIAAAAQDYERLLRDILGASPGRIPQFDLVILGLGTDGHIGSLFPNRGELLNTENLACPVSGGAGGYGRITLTSPVIQRARQIMVLVSGQPKAGIVRAVFGSQPDIEKYPVHLLWPVRDKVVWIMDRQAASLIE